MTGNNSGILLNAVPLTALQIKELETRIAEAGEIFAYLNESGQICFAGNLDTELIKELAWHYANNITSADDLITKTVYKRNTDNTYTLAATYTKASSAADWTPTYGYLDEARLDSFVLG